MRSGADVVFLFPHVPFVCRARTLDGTGTGHRTLANAGASNGSGARDGRYELSGRASFRMHAAMPREFTRSCTPKTFLFQSRVTRAWLSGTPRTGNIARGTRSRRVAETSVPNAASSAACMRATLLHFIVLSVAGLVFFVFRRPCAPHVPSARACGNRCRNTHDLERSTHPGRCGSARLPYPPSRRASSCG